MSSASSYVARMRLIETADAGHAYTFAFVHVRSVLAESWWLYALIVLGDAAYSIWQSTPTTFRAGNLMWIAIFPLLHASARLAKRDYRFKPMDITWIVLLGGAYVCLFCACTLAAISLAAVMKSFAWIPIVTLIVLLAWLLVKLSPIAVFYVLADGGNVLRSVRECWEFTRASSFWAVAGLYLALALTFVIPQFGLLSLMFGIMSNGANSIALFIVAVVANTVALLEESLMILGLTAIVSTVSEPTVVPADSVPSVGA